MHISNKCSVFESDKDTIGWVACKSVGYCEPCKKSMYGKPENDNSEMQRDLNDEGRKKTKVNLKRKRYVLKL